MANCIAKIAMQSAHADRLAEADEDLAAETGDSVVATAADTAQAISTNLPTHQSRIDGTVWGSTDTQNSPGMALGEFCYYGILVLYAYE